jgi:hypothetical protein
LSQHHATTRFGLRKRVADSKHGFECPWGHHRWHCLTVLSTSKHFALKERREGHVSAEAVVPAPATIGSAMMGPISNLRSIARVCSVRWVCKSLVTSLAKSRTSRLIRPASRSTDQALARAVSSRCLSLGPGSAREKHEPQAHGHHDDTARER